MTNNNIRVMLLSRTDNHGWQYHGTGDWYSRRTIPQRDDNYSCDLALCQLAFALLIGCEKPVEFDNDDDTQEHTKTFPTDTTEKDKKTTSDVEPILSAISLGFNLSSSQSTISRS